MYRLCVVRDCTAHGAFDVGAFPEIFPSAYTTNPLCKFDKPLLDTSCNIDSCSLTTKFAGRSRTQTEHALFPDQALVHDGHLEIVPLFESNLKLRMSLRKSPMDPATDFQHSGAPLPALRSISRAPPTVIGHAVAGTAYEQWTERDSK